MISAQKAHPAKKQNSSKTAAPGTSARQTLNHQQLLAAPETLGSAGLLAAQSELGNGVVQRLVDGTVQREFEGISGTANWVMKHLSGGKLHGYFKPNSESADAKNAVLSSSVAKMMVGPDLFSDDRYESHKGSELGLHDPKSLGKSFPGTYSPLVAGTSGFHKEYSKTPLTGDALQEARTKKAMGDNGQFKWEEDTPYAPIGAVFHRHAYHKPAIQKDLANIHTMDAIVGQMDRHSGNLAIDDAGGRARAFDNDLLEGSYMYDKGPTTVYDSFESMRTKQPKKNIFDTQEKYESKLEVWKKQKAKARLEALQHVNLGKLDKTQGLPSHMDYDTVQSLVSLKSKDFLKSLETQDPANYKRISRDKNMLESLRNRYSAVRRYAKAGAAEQHPELLSEKQKSHIDEDYLKQVKKGTMVLPKIVKTWDAQTYNEQMQSFKSRNDPISSARSYMARMVKQYNKAFGGTEHEQFAAGSEHGVIPTNYPEGTPMPDLPGAGITTLTEAAPGPAIAAITPAPVVEPVTVAPVPLPELAAPIANPIPAPPTRSLQHQFRSRDLRSPAPTQMLSGPRVTPIASPVQQPDKIQPGLLEQNALSIIKAFHLENTLRLSAEPDHKRSEVVEQSGELPQHVSASIQKQRGGGASLPEAFKTEASRVFGHDFSNVRIHAGTEAHRLSRSIQAKAFTIGTDIFFKQGAYAPGSSAGREMLMHELTHVVQQAGSSSKGTLRLGAPDSAHEKQAEQISKGSSTPAAKSSGQTGLVQRSYLEEKLSALGGKAKGLARKSKKWGLGQARNLGNEYASHFLGITPFGKKGAKKGNGSSLFDGLF